MLRELAPLLAEEGIALDEHGDLSEVDAPDLETLQHALNRAVERQNLGTCYFRYHLVWVPFPGAPSGPSEDIRRTMPA